MQIGISTYTYTWAFGVPGAMPRKPMSVYSLMEKAVALQVDCIQVADNFPLAEQHPDELAAIREYAGNRNIAVEVGTKGLTAENLDRHIDLAVYFSSPILRMVVDSQNYRPELDTMVTIIREALPKLAEHHIILALENHDRLHASVFKEIVVRTGSTFTGICLDCVNSMGIGEGLETVTENLAPYTVNLHVKDFIVKRVSHMMGFVVEGTPAGKGFLNLPEILGKLRPYNRCGSAILELWTPPAATLEETLEREESWARESIAYLKTLSIQS
jgi:3-oxoisoapionate decarboxylase